MGSNILKVALLMVSTKETLKCRSKKPLWSIESDIVFCGLKLLVENTVLPESLNINVRFNRAKSVSFFKLNFVLTGYSQTTPCEL